MKAILALKHKTLPATINVTRPAALRDGRALTDTPLYVNTKMRPWFTRHGLPRRAGVSAFGFGGANYHCVVEEAEPEQAQPYRVNTRPVPVLISGENRSKLAELVAAELAKLEAAEAHRAIYSFCRRYALAGVVEPSRARVGFLAGTATETAAALRVIQQALARDERTWSLPSAGGAVFRDRALVTAPNTVAALFVGQGAQYPYMFDAIAMNWPPFRRAVSAMDAAQERAGVATPVSAVLYPRAPYEGEPPQDATVLNDTRNAQPATVAAALGVYEIFRSAGFEAAFLGGHSLGELVALYVGGSLSSRAALFDLVIERAHLMAASPSGGQRGAMAAVIGADAGAICCERDDVWVANYNAPDQIVVSGSAEGVQTESQRLKGLGYRVIPLTVSDAFHTPRMAEAGAKFADTITHVGFAPLQQSGAHVFSNVTGAEYPDGESPARQLASHMTSPVRFVEEIQAMHKAGARLFVEFGPGKVLANMVSHILGAAAEDVVIVSVNPSQTRCADVQLRESAIAIAVAGVPLKNFDPWALPASDAGDAAEAQVPPRRQMQSLRLSAATFVSKATLEARKKIINDGYVLPSSCSVALPGLDSLPHVHAGKPVPPEKYLVWGSSDRTPGMLTWHPLAGVGGNPTPGFKPTLFPPRQICFVPFPGNPNDSNHEPGVLPLSWANLAEFSCNKVSRCLGSEFARFDESTTSRSPAFDLQLVTRVVSATGLERGLFYGVDTNPSKGTMVAEFDCPADAWFFHASSDDSHMPYSIIMELSLQNAGILTSWVKAPLTLDCNNVVFRNLDATGELLRVPDCRGKTIVNTATCTQYSMLGSMAIHRFVCELAVDGQPFYRVDTSFGWFLPDVFEKQVGLDNGKLYTPWFKANHTTVEVFALPADESRIFASPASLPLRRRSSQLQFLDEARIASGGGSFGKGYAYGFKHVNPHDWFFSCHFWCDPVMPGSLGVEAMVQLLELLCTRLKVPESVGLKLLRWTHNVGVTKWKYRGQLTSKSKQMEIEVHVKTLDIVPGSHALVIADGFLMVNELRIYSVTDLSVKLVGDATAPSIAPPTVSVPPQHRLPHSVSQKQPFDAAPAEATPASLVLQTLSKATGYDVDLIEPDMDLEQELGIDSIKRVEILSQVQAKIGAAVNTDTLAASKTVRDVITAVAAALPVATAVVAPTPSPAAAAAFVGHPPDMLSSDASALVLNTLAKATGYEPDLIEPDMDLEQELGIDSIKRVEILSQVQAKVGPLATDALAAARTVRDVICAITSGNAQASASTATKEPTNAAAAVKSTVSLPPDRASALVLETLSKATGYETDLIEPDMDLEQELGIDSIKRVEILSQVQAKIGATVATEGLTAARTVQDVIKAVSAAGNAAADMAATRPPPSAPAKAAAPAPVLTTRTTAPSASASSLVLDTLAKATGYEPEQIELDMDLEQELGIDSIKRVEILSQVQAKVGVSARETNALSAAKTVRAVIEAVSHCEVQAPASAATPSGRVLTQVPPEQPHQPHAQTDTVISLDAEKDACRLAPEIDLTWASSKPLPLPAKLALTWPAERPVLLVDGGLTAALVPLLTALGCNVVLITFPNEGPVTDCAAVASVPCADREEATLQTVLGKVQERHGTPTGFIYQNNEASAVAMQGKLKWLLLAAKHISKALHVAVPGGRTFFVTITRLDGQLGLGARRLHAAKVDDLIAAEEGAAFGLCKVLAIEWLRAVFVRAVDIAPSLPAEEAAACAMRELACPDLTLREVGYVDSDSRYTIAPSDLCGAPHTKAPALSPCDVVIVSGGARGITPLCIAALVQRLHGGTFFLLGRTALLLAEPDWTSDRSGQELLGAANAWLKARHTAGVGEQPTPKLVKALVDQVEGSREIRVTLGAIERAGGAGHYVSCDVTDMQSVTSAVAVAALAGPITGIVHGSGIVRDKRIENKLGSDFDTVYGVKLRGLANLLSCIADTHADGLCGLRHLVLFSSLAGYHGNGGQSDYAMANDALNKVAQRAAAALPSCHVLSLCFGPWDGGMVTPVLKAHFSAQGIQVIPRSTGRLKVAAIIAGHDHPVQCLLGNWETPAAAPLAGTQTIHLSLLPPLTSDYLNSVLLSHVIQGRIVVPMTLALGLLSSASLRLQPGWKLLAVEDAHLFRGLAWDEGQLSPIDCCIRLDPEHVTTTELRVKAALHLNQEGRQVPAYSATVVLGKRDAQPLTSVVRTTHGAAVVLEPEAIYDGVTLFHGPLLQGIKAVHAVTAAGLDASCCSLQLTTKQRGQFDAVSGDPFASDLAFQLLLVWVRVQRGQASLPVSASRMEYFTRCMPHKFYATLEITREDGQLLEGTVQFADERGRVLFRATGLTVSMSKTLSFAAALKPRTVTVSDENGTRAPASSEQQASNTANGSQADTTRVAVIGMALRYAGAPDKDAFWKVLVDGIDATSCVSAEFIDSADKSFLLCDRHPKYADAISNDRYGCLDATAPTSEHALLLQLAKCAIADATTRGGAAPTLARCGVVSGCLSFPSKALQHAFMSEAYVPHFEHDLTQNSELRAAASAGRTWGSFATTHGEVDPETVTVDPATYVATKLGFGGSGCPAYCIDAACASALYALKLAQDHLRNGDADIMLCGATCLPDPIFVLSGFSVFQALAARSAPLAKDSEGLTPSEGGAMLLLKRLEDAVHDNNHIYGVLTDVGINNSGAGLPLKPHAKSELSCLRESFARAGLQPADVQYVECHATGTPVGDTAEVEAMRTFFGRAMPLMGSTKGNFGHSLVSAGFAGVCKVLLAMQEGTIPATPKLDRKPADVFVVQANTPWPRCAGPRRAGISAFGFGGTNAHALVEEYRADSANEKPPAPPPRAPAPRLAVIGMAAHFGKLRDLVAFERAVFNGDDAVQELPPKRWRFFAESDAFRSSVLEDAGAKIRGCFVDSITIDHKRLNLPMLDEDQLSPLHLLALRIIDSALTDTQGVIPKGAGARVAVLIGMGTDMELYRHRARVAMRERIGLRGSQPPSPAAQALLDYVEDPRTSFSYTSNIGNIAATRAAALWGLTGPAFTVTEGENSVPRCLEIASGLLARGEVDAAVVAGLDLCGSAEALWAQVRFGGREKLSAKTDHPSASFAKDAVFFVGEGAGAFVLKRADDVATGRVYAVVDGIAAGASAAEAARHALSAAGVAPSDVAAVDAATGTPAELSGLAEVYCSEKKEEKTVALGCVRATVGHCGYAYGAAAFIKAALCIYNRYLPQVPRWTGAAKDIEALLEGSSFYVCTESHAWLANEDVVRHVAVSSADALATSWFHVLFSDYRSRAGCSVRCTECSNAISLDPAARKLMVIRANTAEDLSASAEAAAERAERAPAEELRTLLAKTVAFEDACANSVFALCVMATDATLAQELKSACRGILRAFETGAPWQSPSGSYFVPAPLRSDKVAFVFGDGTASYPSLGDGLYRIWPAAHEVMHARLGALPARMPWDVREVRPDAADRARARFMCRQVDLFSAGVYHSIAFAELAERVLGLSPRAAFGLSMGETAMLFCFSQDNSRHSVQMSEELAASAVWTTDLAGDFNVLRKAFGFPPEAPVSAFYQGYMVQADPAALRAALQAHPTCRARFTMVQAPRGCVVGGVPEDCTALFAELGAKYTPINISLLMHCADVVPYTKVIAALFSCMRSPAELKDLHLFSEVVSSPLQPGAPMGDVVGELCTRFLDFPRSVERVYSAGYNVFIEVGAQNLRTLAVRETLNCRPHVAVALDRKGDSLWNSLLCAAAQLISHGVQGVTVGRLYHPALTTLPESPSLSSSIRDVELNGRYSGVPASQHESLQHEIDYQRARAREYRGPLLWDYDDLLEYAEGDIAPVFNKHLSGEHPPWSTIDVYRRRVRLPQREYLLVSRVTHMHAVTGRYEPSTIRTEYDLPPNGELSEGGDIPLAIVVESGQCDLLLISYLGIDFQNRDQRVYRLLDATLTFYGAAHEGQTLCYDIVIDSFARKGDQIAMFFFHYDCYVNGKLLIEMRNGAAGFFTEEELATGQGIIRSAAELRARNRITKRDVTPFMLRPALDKTTFSEDDMQYFSARGGIDGWGHVLPTAASVRHKLCARKMLMIDRVTHLDPRGGAHGLGLIVGEKFLEHDSWFFPAHFKGDQVVAGSLVSEGCGQLLKVYMAWLGLHIAVGGNPAFRPFPGKANKVRCRGQISPQKGRLLYVMEITDLSFDPATGYPFAVADVDVVNVNDELGQTYDVLAEHNTGAPRRPNAAKIVVDFTGISLWLEGPPDPKYNSTAKVKTKAVVTVPVVPASLPILPADRVATLLLDVDTACPVPAMGGESVVSPAVTLQSLGDPAFRIAYGVDFPLYLGAMAKGIASVDLVVAAGRRRMLASFGAGSVPLDTLDRRIGELQRELPNGPFAVNLIHSPFNPSLEDGCVGLLLRRGVRVVEASAFMSLTPAIVRYRVAGLEALPSGGIACRNHVIFKVSRTELAELAMRPPPADIVARLVADGLLSPAQAALAPRVPMADDVTVEADSGGHTDNRPLHVIFPIIRALAERVNREQHYATRVRVGAAGGIGCPEAALAAFAMGAAFVVTGTINQLSRQAGTSDGARAMLAAASYADIGMAPAADMFDQGVQLQVLKRGTLFPGRARKLYQLYCDYPSLEALPPAKVAELEKTIFRRPLSDVWSKTAAFYRDRLHDTAKLAQAEADPKLKMSLIFRWYLGKSSAWATKGSADRAADYQVWCGPCIGAYNEWVRGTVLDPAASGGAWPCVVQQNLHLLRGACYLARLEVLRRDPRVDTSDLPYTYHPVGTL
eukprot:TRINITY_DN500_c0_g1_i6.p1 TRINITY_DN500_c0_g1~~TRINITY_DN500_c0_g1_i6.p1  ORF type:complete len:4763 (+),score=1014.87 TRINITY_DN500_c0_g1_i6:363-14651(+)